MPQPAPVIPVSEMRGTISPQHISNDLCPGHCVPRLRMGEYGWKLVGFYGGGRMWGLWVSFWTFWGQCER